MHRLQLTKSQILLLQEDSAPLARWTWSERHIAVATLRDCGFSEAADWLNEFVRIFPVEEFHREQLMLDLGTPYGGLAVAA